jgi:Aldo/keto reductase family
MTMMAYGVLARGMLSAQVPKVEEMSADDIRAQLPRFHSANVENNLRLRSALEAVARRKNATLAQLAIAWPLAQGSRAGAFIVPIPGEIAQAPRGECARRGDCAYGRRSHRNRPHRPARCRIRYSLSNGTNAPA